MGTNLGENNWLKEDELIFDAIGVLLYTKLDNKNVFLFIIFIQILTEENCLYWANSL